MQAQYDRYCLRRRCRDVEHYQRNAHKRRHHMGCRICARDLFNNNCGGQPVHGDRRFQCFGGNDTFASKSEYGCSRWRHLRLFLSIAADRSTGSGTRRSEESAGECCQERHPPGFPVRLFVVQVPRRCERRNCHPALCLYDAAVVRGSSRERCVRRRMIRSRP